MKMLVIFLLVLNIALLVWQYSTHVDELTREAVTSNPLPANAPSLTMISELDELPPLKEPAPKPDLATTEYSEVHEHVKKSSLCLDIGPFAETAARDRLRDWLRDYIAVLTVRSVAVRKRQFFWVYLEPSSDATARRNLDDLIERGVTDYMLIRRGNLKNAISLGLFRSQDSVNRRLAELSEKGYTPVVVPRFETTDQYWITVQLAADHAEGLELPAALLGDAQSRTVTCEPI